MTQQSITNYENTNLVTFDLSGKILALNPRYITYIYEDMDTRRTYIEFSTGNRHAISGYRAKELIERLQEGS